MASTWDHPDLGEFGYDGMDFTRVVDVPAFQAFAYDSGDGPSTGECNLAFEVANDEDVPSPAGVELAGKVLANQEGLVTKVVQALWDDFNGRGPETGMYWHGDLNQVAEGLEDQEPPGSADDLLMLLSLSSIRVQKGIDGYNKTVVELQFQAAFEEEHGVGILTDGEEILGIGYHSDVSPFKRRSSRGSG